MPRLTMTTSESMTSTTNACESDMSPTELLAIREADDARSELQYLAVDAHGTINAIAANVFVFVRELIERTKPDRVFE